ncbi:MAG: tRNA 2-thiouridine(34) synthase MnmA [Candidatus Nomurabacteria bacterium]|nr:tRNA 2-thiouridine(34) synthase MnmA [Candidatus Nomurabacteria bacterium]
MSQKVFVGLSGGVDSSVSAALLVEQGYDVTGVYMKNWSRDLPGMKCPWAEDLADAKRVAVRLGIDLKVFDFESEYKHKVVDYMVAEYQAGRTPNPDVMCNQEIKFKLFYEVAREQGADFIATGHYAQAQGGQLLKAVDEDKDQTYFLYRVSKEALRYTLFPVGGLHKPEVRELARKFGLVTASKKESMGVCFVGNVGIREFLSEYVEPKLGDIVDEATGKVVGQHDGAIFYTIGQRHGLSVGGGLPYYVTRKDMSKNVVFITTNLNDGNLWVKELKLQDIFTRYDLAKTTGTYLARVRHRAPLVKASLVLQDTTLQERSLQAVVKFEDEQRAVASGQSVVFYDGEVCFGGGVVV